MLIGVARADAQRRQVREAAAALLQAETTTPGQVSSHSLVRQLMSDLLTTQAPRHRAPGPVLAPDRKNTWLVPPGRGK
jgi:hypothetical protein